MKLLIDTNIYLDFYRSNNVGLKLLGEIEHHFDRIVLTEQIINEFQRNRETIIRNLKQNFVTESSLQHFSSSFLQSLPEFQNLVKIKKDFEAQRKIVANIIEDVIESQANDPIANFFNSFVNYAKTNDAIFYTNDGIIAKAHKRKLIGNPPATLDKYSIGDEINWETVLENVDDDIIIVGRDGTYKNNLKFLQRDFHRHTGKFIVKITDRITDGLQEAGLETSEDLKRVEDAMIEELKHYNEYWKKPLKDNDKVL